MNQKRQRTFMKKTVAFAASNSPKFINKELVIHASKQADSIEIIASATAHMAPHSKIFGTGHRDLTKCFGQTSLFY